MKIRCLGITGKGTQCTRIVDNPPGRCWQTHGSYLEDVPLGPMVIDKPTRLVGVNHDHFIVLSPGSGGSVLEDVQCRGLHIYGVKNVKVDGVEVIDPLPHSTAPNAEAFGVWVRDSEHVLITRAYVHDSNGKGISVSRSRWVHLDSCVVHSTEWTHSTPPPSAGIYFSQCENCTVYRSAAIDPMSHGLKLSGQCRYISVRDSWFRQERGWRDSNGNMQYYSAAVLFQGAQDCLMEGCLVEGLNPVRPAIRAEDHPHPERGAESWRNHFIGNTIRSASKATPTGFYFSPGKDHPQSIERQYRYERNREIKV